MSKTEPSPKKKKVPTGIIGFAIAFLLFVTIGSLMKDSQQAPQPYGVAMGIMWGGAFASFFVVWMLYFAYFILPGSTHAGWNLGYRLLGRYYVYQSKTYLDHRTGQFRERKKRRERRSATKEPPASTYTDHIDQIGAGVVPTHNVLALDNISRKAKANEPRYKTQHGPTVGFSRAAGPGIVILEGRVVKKTEKISLELDMRPHLRRERVETITNDGIKIETDVIVIFHVNRATQPEEMQGNQEGNDDDKTLLYPYDEEDIRRIRYAPSIDAKLNVSKWNDHIAPSAAILLADELSSRTLEQLHDVDGFALQDIRRIVKERLEKRLNSATTTDEDGNVCEEYKSSGITITAVNLTPIKEPERIQKQRLALWKMEIEEQIAAQKLDQQAQSARDIQNMRAAAQIEIVSNIIESIQSMYDAQNVDLSEIVTLRMVAALEEAMKNESLMSMTPQTMTYWVTDSIKQLHALLDEEK